MKCKTAFGARFSKAYYISGIYAQALSTSQQIHKKIVYTPCATAISTFSIYTGSLRICVYEALGHM